MKDRTVASKWSWGPIAASSELSRTIFLRRSSAGWGEINKAWANIRADSGATVVEFTVSAGVLFLVLFGIIEMCLALYTYDFVSDAARAGTRYAIVRGSSCSNLPDCGATKSQIQTFLQGFKYPGINSSSLNASVTWFSASATQPTTWTSCGTTQCDLPGNAVQVQVTYAFPLHIPYWRNATVNISSSSQMVISQ